MIDIFQYIEKNSSLSFHQKPLTEVDHVIISRLAYFNYQSYIGKTISYVAKMYDYSGVYKQSKKLLKFAGKTKRYGNIIIDDFIYNEENSFLCSLTAATFRLDNNEKYIAFGGTNKSICSIYEDSNMIIEFPIQSQVEALNYINSKCMEDSIFYLGGHSKGGNLAFYSFIYTNDEIRNKIKGVYNIDGPGLPIEIDNTLIDEKQLNKVSFIAPRDSIFGRVYGGECNEYSIIDSHSLGIYQHNPFRWKIVDDKFKKENDFSNLSDIIDDTIKESFNSIEKQRVEPIYQNAVKIADYAGIKGSDSPSVSSTIHFLGAIKYSTNKKRNTKEILKMVDIVARKFIRSITNNIKA